MFKQTIFFLLALFTAAYSSEIPEPYRSINDLTFNNQGSFNCQPSLIDCLKTKPMTVIEVGSQLGLSTRFIARRLPPGAKIYAVDTWGGLGEDSPNAPYIYQLFLSNIKHVKKTHMIIPIRMESLEAAYSLDVKADLIYIESSHANKDIYEDIIVWHQHLKPQGILCGSDWQYWFVRQSVTQAANDLNRSIDTQDNFWKLE